MPRIGNIPTVAGIEKFNQKRYKNRIVKNFSYGLILDPNDIHLLHKHTFVIDHNGYAITFIMHKNTKLHRLIMGPNPKGLITDHINRNKLDNRRENLRFVDYTTNNLNRSSGTQYKYLGCTVFYDKYRGKWKAYFRGKYAGVYLDKDGAMHKIRTLEQYHCFGVKLDVLVR